MTTIYSRLPFDGWLTLGTHTLRFAGHTATIDSSALTQGDRDELTARGYGIDAPPASYGVPNPALDQKAAVDITTHAPTPVGPPNGTIAPTLIGSPLRDAATDPRSGDSRPWRATNNDAWPANP